MMGCAQRDNEHSGREMGAIWALSSTRTVALEKSLLLHGSPTMYNSVKYSL